MEKLGIEPVQLLTQVINFSLMVFLLTKLLYKPVIKTLEERKKKIEQGLKDAQEAQKKLEEFEEKKKIILIKAKQEAKKIIDNAKGLGKKVEADIIKEAENKAKEIITQTRKDLEEEREKMKTELQNHTIKIASAIAQKALAQVLDDTDHKNVIDKKIKQLSKMTK